MIGDGGGVVDGGNSTVDNSIIVNDGGTRLIGEDGGVGAIAISEGTMIGDGAKVVEEAEVVDGARVGDGAQVGDAARVGDGSFVVVKGSCRGYDYGTCCSVC